MTIAVGERVRWAETEGTSSLIGCTGVVVGVYPDIPMWLVDWESGDEFCCFEGEIVAVDSGITPSRPEPGEGGDERLLFACGDHVPVLQTSLLQSGRSEIEAVPVVSISPRPRHDDATHSMPNPRRAR